MVRFKYVTVWALFWISLVSLVIAGCGQQTSSDEMNSSMNARQKAAIREHKQRQDE